MHNLVGQRFNMGTVIKDAGRTKDGQVLWMLKCDCGNTYTSSGSYLKSCNKKSCGCHRKHIRAKNLIKNIGEKYGMLTVIDIDGTKNSSNTLYRKCKCDCGNEKYATLSSLTSGSVTSCGCKNNKKGKNHPLYQGYKDISLRYWNRIKANAKNRNIDFLISMEYAWEIWEKQGKKCALSGQNLTFAISKSSDYTASLDRIDSSAGYIEGNVQWIHKDINKIKTDFHQEKFIELCILITKHKNRGVE